LNRKDTEDTENSRSYAPAWEQFQTLQHPEILAAGAARRRSHAGVWERAEICPLSLSVFSVSLRFASLTTSYGSYLRALIRLILKILSTLFNWNLARNDQNTITACGGGEADCRARGMK